MTAGKSEVSEVYFARAPALMVAFVQLKSHGWQEFPSEMPTQSESLAHDWS
jgi:hypothetical protein